MDREQDERAGTGFLPPQPAGPEPELGPRPAQPPQTAAAHVRPAGPEPDNGPALTGFVLALVSGGLLVITAGLSSVISVVTAIFGLVYSRRGKRKVSSGETTKHAGLAQAGLVISWISLGLATLATLLYALVVVLLITDEGFRNDFEDQLEGDLQMSALIAVRMGARLVGA